MRDRPTPSGTTRPASVKDCRWLRWKTMYLDREPDEAVPDMVDGFVWCVHTMNCLGPDGEVAGHDDCAPGRGCYEPLVTLGRAT